MADDDEDDFDDDDEDSNTSDSSDDDDDTSDDDDHGPSQGRRSRMAEPRGRRDGRGGDGGGGRDLASDPRFMVRLFSNIIQIGAGALGSRMASTAWMTPALNAIEGVIGDSGLRLASAGVAALIQNPRMVKSALANMGVPEEYVGLLDEAIDSFVHGLAHAHTGRGKITEGDYAKALSEAKSKLEGTLDRQVAFGAALLALTPAEQVAFRNRLATLSDDDKKSFEAYRAKIAGTRWELRNLLQTLLAIPAASWLEHLRLVYGDIKPAKKEGSLMSKAFGLLKEADDAVVGAIKPPATGPDPVVDALDAFTNRLRRKRGQ
ncbi:MAG: hypothetical protein RDU25_06025 [Patescibacteria group bacterium]|nr:hypothetical protein [Patescibacteria group bacterium]